MSAERPVRLVVGASRGIGLALAEKQLEDSGVQTVIATHRPGSDRAGLDALQRQHRGRLVLSELDVCDTHSLEGFTEMLSAQGGRIDLAIHAAGILHEDAVQPEKSLGQCRPEHLARLFEVNSIGPLMVARAVVPRQARSQPFVFAALSAMVGSIGDNRLGGWYGYRASKAALNQFLRTLANECRISHPAAAVVALHPGTTDTALSRPFQRSVDPRRLYSARQTAERILTVLEGLGPEQSGRFYNWDGSQIPW
jgi:NAD(P)-dependent dehydrogenase (short-subunit alcohol dehydrogenase family)